MSAEATLDKIMAESPYNAKFPLSKEYIIKAMESYAKEIAEKACKEQRELCSMARFHKTTIIDAPQPDIDKIIENT